MLGALSKRRPPIAALPAVLLLVIAAWETCATRRDAGAVPDDVAWDRAAAIVRAGYHPGDLIVFAPQWVDAVGRLHLGDLIPIDMAARMDAARYGRIWELSIRGARAPDTANLAPASEDEVDGVTVRRFEREPAHVLADLRDRLAGAKVDGGAASLELAEVGFAPHRCIQVTPVPGRPVQITFAQLPLGTSLVGYVGLADVFTRRDIRAPGSLAVEIGGKTATEVTPGVDDGWVRFELPTQPGNADVTFRLGADAPQRLICFAAETRT
jgi:hypothetical protein